MIGTAELPHKVDTNWNIFTALQPFKLTSSSWVRWNQNSLGHSALKTMFSIGVKFATLKHGKFCRDYSTWGGTSVVPATCCTPTTS